MVFVLISNLVMLAIVEEVNRKLPDEQRISEFWWYVAKYERTFREYRRLYPAGRLIKYFYGSVAMGVLLLVASAWQFGFFR
jgi:hypothetical protein